MRAHIFKSIFCAAIIFGALWVGWMLNDNTPPYIWYEEESTVTPNPALDGGRLSVSWKMKVNRLCPGSSQRTLTDASRRKIDGSGNPVPWSGPTVATYDATPAALSVRLEDDRLIRTFVLPRGLPPLVGYSSTVCFQCNPLQALFPLCVRTPELVFSVAQ